MEWTGPEDLTAQLVQLWNRGRFLATSTGESELFPLRLRLRGPDAKALGSRFDEVRSWIRSLEEGSRARRGFGYEIEWASTPRWDSEEKYHPISPREASERHFRRRRRTAVR
jgi:hypothetical protein